MEPESGLVGSSDCFAFDMATRSVPLPFLDSKRRDYLVPRIKALAGMLCRKDWAALIGIRVELFATLRDDKFASASRSHATSRA